MRDSDFDDRLRLTYEALILVSQGKSERSAVSEVISAKPRLGHEKSSALALVVDAISRLDQLDNEVESAFPGVKLDEKSIALFRIAAHVMRSNNDASKEGAVQALRRLSTGSDGPRLEFFLGYLVAVPLPAPPRLLDESQRVGFQTHNLGWWVSYCFYHFGRGTGLKILSAPPRPRYVRVNPLRNRGRTTPPVEIRKHLPRPTDADLDVYRLAESLSPLSKYFELGLFQVQDLASYLAVKAAEPAPGEDVLELCAAPGGKTATLAQLMKNRGGIVSVDYSPPRMSAWTREIERLGVKIATPVVGDAARLGLNGEFDLVILDPPCTGTGILDRNPRMKWHLSPNLVQKYSRLQSRMLEEASKYARLGGRVLYCTCSLTLEENELVVSKFLIEHPDFVTRPILKDYGSGGLRGQDNCRRFYPHRDRTAGYFVARLERFKEKVRVGDS